MAELQCDRKINVIELSGVSGKNYYQSCHTKSWQELQATLKAFGIVFSSKYDLNFIDEEYQIMGVPKHFGARDAKVYYGDTLIAEASVEGSNYCDQEAKVVIYMGALKSVYKKDKVS